MTTQDKRSMDPAVLRQKAEELAAARKLEDSETLSLEEIHKTLHELQVHQIELEMQNDELRTAHAEIEAGRGRYLDLYDMAPAGYCTLSKKGMVLEANLTACTLLGTTRDKLVKQPITRFILKDDQDIYYLHRMKLFEEGNPQECELRLVKPGGALIWAHLSATVAQAEDSEPVCRVVISDITERKLAEDASMTAHKLLKVKNEEMEQFVYSVSHDLKSPLITVRTFLSMLQQDLLVADQQQINEDLSFIGQAADKMHNMLEALQHYSRIGKKDAQPQILAVSQQIDDCLNALAGNLRQKKVEVVICKTDYQVHGDPLHFGSIWQNLIENAVKYRGDQAHLKIEIGATQQGQDVVFYVRDNGMGVAPEHSERIFNLFSQLDPQIDGAGLGLALVKKIVTIYQGRIWVESAGEGQGSCFMFTLPGAHKRKGVRE